MSHGLDDSLWKEIPGFSGYEAHPDGEIRNKKTKRILLAESKSHQYRCVTLNGKSIVVHRLIALTFCPNPSNLPEVNHKSGNKRNNKAENLEWLSRSDNVRHAVSMGRKKAKPTRQTKVRIIMRNGEIHTYDSVNDAARAMNIRRCMIDRCLMSHGVYVGRKRKNKQNEWLWKVERVIEEKQKLSSVEEKEITVEGFTHLIARSNGEILNKKRKSLGFPDGQYLRVSAPWLGKIITKAAHILIASTFIPNPENKPYVNHISGNKLDNSVSNLEWVTHQENMQHAHRTGLINAETKKRIKEKVIVSVYKLELDGSIIRKFDSVKEASIFTGSGSNISAVCSSYLNKKYKGRHSSLGYGWCYVKDYTIPVTNKTLEKVFPELVNRKDIDYDKIRSYVVSGSRPIWQIDIDGTRIKLWESPQEAEKKIPNTSVANIFKSIKSNGNRLSGLYLWEKVSYEDIITLNGKKDS